MVTTNKEVDKMKLSNNMRNALAWLKRAKRGYREGDEFHASTLRGLLRRGLVRATVVRRGVVYIYEA
jgi:hypothetical protein